MSCPGSPSPRSKENARGCDGGVNAGGGGRYGPRFGVSDGGSTRGHTPTHSSSAERTAHGFAGKRRCPCQSVVISTRRSGLGSPPTVETMLVSSMGSRRLCPRQKLHYKCFLFPFLDPGDAGRR